MISCLTIYKPDCSYLFKYIRIDINACNSKHTDTDTNTRIYIIIIIIVVARISLTLSRHSSLSFIALGRSSGQHPVFSHSCWMYVRAGRPAFARPCVGVHKSTSLMSSSLLLQQCPACLVRLTWIVFVIGAGGRTVGVLWGVYIYIYIYGVNQVPSFVYLNIYFLPPITKTIQVRRARHAGHCWRSKDELVSDVLLWSPTYGQAKAGRPARTYIQQLCEDTGCNPEDLLEAMNDREKWREMVKDIRAGGTTWWWWWWWWYVYIWIHIFIWIYIMKTAWRRLILSEINLKSLSLKKG